MEITKKYNFQKHFWRINFTTPEMVNARKEIPIPTLLSNYDLNDIYNADEFGLFYKCMTNKT